MRQEQRVQDNPPKPNFWKPLHSNSKSKGFNKQAFKDFITNLATIWNSTKSFRISIYRDLVRKKNDITTLCSLVDIFTCILETPNHDKSFTHHKKHEQTYKTNIYLVGKAIQFTISYHVYSCTIYLPEFLSYKWHERV